MMSPAAKIGLLSLVALLIVGVFVVKIEDLQLGGDHRHVVRVILPSAAGVDRLDPVRIAGVRVGKVEEVALEGGQALLTISLEPGVTLHVGATARVASLGMLGDKYVELLPGDEGAPPLSDGATIKGGKEASLDDALRLVSDIGADVKEVTSALRSVLGGEKGAARIDEIVENVRVLSASLREMVNENRTKVGTTTDNLSELSAVLREQLPQLAAKLERLADELGQVVSENRGNLQTSMANLRDLSERLKVAADNVNTITGKIAAGEGSIGKLIADDTTVKSLNQTLDTVTNGVKTFQDTMGRVQRFRLDVTLQTEALLDESESRTSFGFDLSTTDRRFFRVEGVDSPFGRPRTTTETITTSYPDGSEETLTRTVVKTEDKLLINAQVGYRLLPTTAVRVGLIESTAGFGVDQTLKIHERPLRLSFEAYDFDREEDSSPHLRLEGRFFFTNALFVSAGWDDPTFSERRSVLVGAGVSWTDEDLKYSLGLLGSAFR